MSFFSVNVPFHILGTMMDQKNAMKLNPGGGCMGDLPHNWTICKYAGREITDADISTSHRNGSVNNTSNAQPGMPTTNKKVPDIYVRFTRRDVKTEVFEKRKNLAINSACPTKYRNVAIYEDVTPLRSRIMYELRQRDDKKKFKHVWSRGGRIFCKTPEQAETPSVRPTVINKPEDLDKVGFTAEEIEAIILNKRE